MTDLSGNTVTANKYFNIICSAQANPPAKYRFYREQESLFNTSEGGNAGVYETSVSARMDKVIYSCIPFNDYGDGPPKMITVEVHCKYTYVLKLIIIKCIIASYKTFDCAKATSRSGKSE